MTKLEKVLILCYLAVALAALVSCGVNSKSTSLVSPKIPNALEGPYKVIRVTDGDTIRVAIDGKSEAIRIVGYNSPEKYRISECGGKEASVFASNFLSGKTVYLERDKATPDRDSTTSHRLLRHVWVESELFAFKAIENGYGRELTYKGQLYRYRSEFQVAQEFAKKKQRGIWDVKENGGCQ